MILGRENGLAGARVGDWELGALVMGAVEVAVNVCCRLRQADSKSWFAAVVEVEC